MNLNTRLVLWFTQLRKPIDPSQNINLDALRKKSEQAARLGTLLYNKKVRVDRVEDLDADGIPVRIYHSGSGKNRPVIVHYHGGGFVLYGLASHDAVCRRLSAMNQAIVVSADYRLAPEHPWPAAHEDAIRTLNWTRNQAQVWGLDPENIFVAGDSAGGNLSACVAHHCRARGIRLKGQILVYPWIDGKLSNPSIDRNGKGFLLEKETMFWFQQQYTPREEDRLLPELSPCYQKDFANLAPALILTASLDPLLDDGIKYHEQLLEHGVSSTYREFQELFHGFFNLPYLAPGCMQAYEEVKQFIHRQMSMQLP